MSELRSNTPFDVDLRSALISTNRLGDQTFEIRRSIVELNIYENIETLGISGDLILVDDAGLFQAIDWQGSEYLDLTIGFIDPGLPPIKRRFVVTSLQESAKGNDASETFSMSIEDEMSYLDNLKNVNKVYNGTPKEIISKILKDNFTGRDLIAPGETYQRSMRVIIPNWRPHKAIHWLASRSTCRFGTPYFAFSCFKDTNVRFFDMAAMIGNSPLNISTKPYRYSTSYSQEASNYTINDQSYMISGFSQKDNENIYDIIDRGGISGRFDFLDTQNFYNNRFEYKVTDTFEKLKKTSGLYVGKKTPNFDKIFEIDNKNLQDFSSVRLTNVSTSKIYNDISGYHEALNPAGHATKATHLALKEFMSKSKIDIVVAGRNFLSPGSTKYPNFTIGNTIKVEFQESKAFDAGTNAAKVMPDAKRTGTYLIQACRHMIRQNKGKFRHDCVLELVKIANDEGTTVV